jgi:uncharacterized protein YbjT (DUF2867 family)
MTILVTGATGNIGARVITELVKRGAEVRALVRDPGKARLPEGVQVVKGDMLDVDSIRAALRDVSTLFLLNAVVPDEFTQALITLNLARKAGIERIVYFSVIHSYRYVNVPHFAAKHAVERMIKETGMYATILRPAYFIENDLSLKDTLLSERQYSMPIGRKGLAMVDVRDIAEIAAFELLRREQATTPLPVEVIDVVGPDDLTGTDIAAIWSEVLGFTVTYAGDDTEVLEQTLKAFSPSWAAYDMRLMADGFQRHGMVAKIGDREKLTRMLGHPLRSYRGFAAEAAAKWL